MKRTGHIVLAMLAFSVCMAGGVRVAAAQVGGGWTEIQPGEAPAGPHDRIKRAAAEIHGAIDGAGMAGSAKDAATLQTLSCIFQRVDRDVLDEYFSGTRQLQADVTIPRSSITDGLRGSAWQIVKAASDSVGLGEAHLGIFAGMDGQRVRLNSIRDADSGVAWIYLDGSLAWKGKSPGEAVFARVGCRGPLGAGAAKIKLRNVKIFSGGDAE